jgi:wobble nucleotide-excising tRNase
MPDIARFNDLNAVATHLRQKFSPDNKKAVLIYAHNGIGKTQLSMVFKELGKADNDTRDTLYFNAFTEDLFYWDNDIVNNDLHTLKINTNSKFFNGLVELEMENRIRPLLSRYADFDFKIDYQNGSITFEREIRKEGETPKRASNIKVSRGEENIFIWCFFLVVAQLAVDQQEAYKWVKYLYIDDPVSSLDDNNVIAIACHLSQLLKDKETKKVKINTVISTHHALFFNVMFNEIRKGRLPFYFNRSGDFTYVLEDTQDTPSFHHVALLKQLHEVVVSGKVYDYHFNILRNILEKTATFHGFDDFSACIRKDDQNDPDGLIHERILNLLSHGGYSLFEPRELLEDNKQYLKQILDELRKNYRFNSELFKTQEMTGAEQT